jgi:hypothetical protein
MVASSAFAEVNFSGFGTFAGGVALNQNSLNSPNIHGYEETLSFSPNSFIGGQVFADIAGELDAVVQITADASTGWNSIDNLNFDLSWVFLNYRFNDNWSLQAGRQRMPHYAYSDCLDISYAYHWIQAPTQLYNAPFNSFNGISLLNDFEIANVSFSTQLLYGGEPDYEEDIGKQYSDIWGGKVIARYQWLTATAGYFEFREYSESKPGAPQPDAPPPPVKITEGVLKSWDAALTAEIDDWFIIAEITSVDLTNLGNQYGTLQPVMLSIVKNIGAISPHISFGYNRELYVNRQDSTSPFYIVGTRWDISNSTALKVEFSSEQDQNDTNYTIETALVAAFF